MDNLDAQELLHLAMHASSQDRHDDAIGHLKRAVELESDNAFVCFMLAAEYAQLGLYDRALDNFAKTTELAPDLHVARVQHGLLLTALDRLDEAKSILDSLMSLDEENSYRLFAAGLLALIAEDLNEAKALIERGIANNQENVPLNGDFQRIIDNIEQQLNPNAAVADESEPEEDKSEANSFLLSSYQK